MKTKLAVKLNCVAASLCGLMLFFPAPAKSQRAGNFDYYLLALSWSPEFCYSHRDSPECGKHLGLIVHGLWPQYSNSPSGPEHCGNQPGLANPGSMLDIMPDPHLIDHEWTTHGTCSGMSANDYFGMIRRLYNSIHVPGDLQQPRRQFIIRTAALKQDFERVNPGLNDDEIALGCTGPYLNAVEFCFTKDGKLTACRAVRDCKAPSLRVPAVR